MVAAHQTKKGFFSKDKNKPSLQQRHFSRLIASNLKAILTKMKNTQKTLKFPKNINK